MDSTITEKETENIFKFKNNKKKVFIETYGCQMNVSDSEVVAGLLEKSGFSKTESEKDANIIFCATFEEAFLLATQKADRRTKCLAPHACAALRQFTLAS